MSAPSDTCPKCGKTAPESAARCPACGHLLRHTMDAAQAQQLANEIARGCAAIDSGWVYIARRLHQLDEHAGYRALGHESLASWIEASPLKITIGRVVRTLRIYRFFVIEHGISESEIEDIPPSRLARVKTPIEDERVDVDEAVEEARVFTEHELGEHYHQTQPPTKRPSAFAAAVKTITQAQIPGLEDRRLAVVPIDRSDFARLVAAEVLIERSDGLVDLRVPVVNLLAFADETGRV